MKTKIIPILLMLTNISIFAANIDSLSPSMPYNAKHCFTEISAENTYYAYNGWEFTKRTAKNPLGPRYDDVVISTLTNANEQELLEIIESSYSKEISHCSAGDAVTIEVIAGTLNGEMINVEMECTRILSPSSGPKPETDPYYTGPNQYCY